MVRRTRWFLAGLTALAALAPAAPAAAVESVPAIYAPKAKPPPLGAAAATSFFYAQAAQAGTASGGFGSFDVARPSGTVAGTHSLAELAVSSADGKQIVEVGWTVDPSTFGDTEPRLFVYHWVDGKQTCYNGCGFVPLQAGGGPVGRKLTVGSVQYLAIRHAADAWWISADGIGWLGYFPDSLWGGRYTAAATVQWFGEVADVKAASCIDMGYGVFGGSIFASRIFNVGRFDAGATDIATGNSHPALYTALKFSKTELRYGGPGAC